MSKLSSVLKPTNGKSQPGQVMVVRPSFTSFQTERAEEAAVDEVPEPVAEVIPEPIVEVKPEPVVEVKPEPELLFFVRTSLEIRFFFVTAPAKKKPGKKKTG